MRAVKRIRISSKKFSLIVTCFSLDLPALTTASLSSLNRNTVNHYYRFLKLLVLRDALRERQLAGLSNGIEIDESYFGPRRVRGRRGRGAGRKIVVLGLLKRQGRVYTSIIPDAKAHTVMPIICQ